MSKSKEVAPVAPKYEIISTMHGDFKTLKYTETYKRRKPWAPVNPKLVVSFIPGTVIEIMVKEGQHVKEGDKLILFKAMKMDSVITAESSGVIKKIHASVGDIVPKGSLILEFE